MNVAMLTNTFTPHVGGVARSVESFRGELVRRGHRVLVVAPEFPGTPRDESDVVRIPALQHFNGSDFSVPVPVPVRLRQRLDSFAPDVVHSHHPFLLGDTALRIGATRNLPVVFTHHTLYERYTHYVPGSSPRLQRFASDLAVGYCNLCDAVVAPSESIAALLRERGVSAPLHVIPTGVDLGAFAAGDGERGRRRLGIPPGAFVVGHVGRLAVEKNLAFLASAVVRFLAAHPTARLLVAGAGPFEVELVRQLAGAGVAARLHLAGVLDRQELADAYRAMDVFAFASHSETQGMVLTEAMAAGVPVVAVDAPGVREVVRDGANGRLLAGDDPAAFAEALDWVAAGAPARRRELCAAALATAESFSLPSTTGLLLALYAELRARQPLSQPAHGGLWHNTRRLLSRDWEILHNIATSARQARERGGVPIATPEGD
jgi:glycosyltransferase involved in cell wall biosynthesis